MLVVAHLTCECCPIAQHEGLNLECMDVLSTSYGAVCVTRVVSVGVTVTFTLFCRAAVELIDRTLPDIVLLDIKMPGLSGFQILQEATHKLKALMGLL